MGKVVPDLGTSLNYHIALKWADISIRAFKTC